MIVRTVLGDVAPGTLGWTLGHEHLVARPPALVEDDDLRLDDEDAAARELASFRDAGGGAVVEMTTVDYGRDAAALARLAERTGVRIVAATGFNKGRFSDGIVARYSDETLMAWMEAEVRTGALPWSPPEEVALRVPRPYQAAPAPTGDAPVRAGLIKASTGAGGPSEGERRGMTAAIEAHRRTGAPIGTHTEKADWALQQARTLREGGVPGEKALIGHLDFRPELPYLLEVAATGVFLGLDQFSKAKYLSDEARVRLIAALASEGRLPQLIVSGDLARRSYWPSYGHVHAPGLTHLPRVVASMLRAEGLDEEALRTLFVDNPRRWLAFEPR